MKNLKLPLWDFYQSMWEWPLEMDMYWMFVVFTIIAIGVLALIVWGVYTAIYDHKDKITSTTETLNAVIIDKRYKGEETHHGTGTATVINSSGGLGLGVVSTTSHSPEEFLIFVKADMVYKIDVDMQYFYDVNIGDKVRIENTIGGLSKKILSTEII